jgi:hypothetical protein
MATITPNMSLTVPVVGDTAAPDYGLNINTCMSILDQHNHSPGSGVPITPDGLDITSDLSLQNNNLLSIRSLRFTSQVSPISQPTDLNCLSVSGVDLYYRDGSGNSIRMTQGGAISGTSGTITGLISPASAVYYPGLQDFVFQSGINTPGSIDAGPLTIRKLTALSAGITIEPSASIASDYTLTLPAALPANNSFLTVSTSGTVSALNLLGQLTTANLSASANITGSQLAASANIVGTQLSSSANILGSQLDAAANIAGSQIASATDLTGTITIDSRPIAVAKETSAGQMRIVTGNVTPAFAVGRGVGFSVSSIDSSQAQISFTTAFNNIPIVVVTQESSTVPTSQVLDITLINSSQVRVKSLRNSDGSTLVGFSFIAIGS